MRILTGEIDGDQLIAMDKPPLNETLTLLLAHIYEAEHRGDKRKLNDIRMALLDLQSITGGLLLT